MWVRKLNSKQGKKFIKTKDCKSSKQMRVRLYGTILLPFPFLPKLHIGIETNIQIKGSVKHGRHCHTFVVINPYIHFPCTLHKRI